MRSVQQTDTDYVGDDFRVRLNFWLL